jgi:hypothetical protein
MDEPVTVGFLINVAMGIALFVAFPWLIWVWVGVQLLWFAYVTIEWSLKETMKDAKKIRIGLAAEWAGGELRLFALVCGATLLLIIIFSELTKFGLI